MVGDAKGISFARKYCKELSLQDTLFGARVLELFKTDLRLILCY